jgi:type I restriction enzyme, S subunit
MRDGWVETTLGECLKLKSGDGLTAKKMVKHGDYNVFGGNGINGRHNDYNLEGEQVIIGRVGALCGNVHLVNEKIWLTDNAFRVAECYHQFDYPFLAYLLRISDLGKTARQAAQPVISNTSVKSVRVAFPSDVRTQRAIVAILDEAFAGITTAVANTEKNLANARELFESHLNAVFEQKGEGWDAAKLGNLCEFVRGPFGGSLKKSSFVEAGFAVYEQQHAINDQFDRIRYFIDEQKFSEMARFELRPGDLIMSCSGTMGRVAIAPKGIPRGIINQALLKLAPGPSISGEFLQLWMRSNSFQEQIAARSKGVAITNVASVKVLKGIEAPLPAIDEQRLIVGHLHELEAKTEQLGQLITRKRAVLEALRQSILQKAFAGELTARPDKTLAEASL